MVYPSENENSNRRDPPTLRVHLLGQPDVTWAGGSLALERRQVRALLYRLADGARPVPREELCHLFWPEVPEASARRNLRVLLSHLRRALPAPDLVQKSGDHVELDPERTWSDTTAFECLEIGLAGAGLAGAGLAGPAQTGALQQAVDLYRGPFLAGFSLPGCPEFEMWATVQRRIWEHTYLETLALLIEDLAARGEHPAAITQARRYLATDDLAEEIHRRLIELCAANHDRAAALRQYEQCASILERELGVTPLPDTQAAYHAAVADQELPWSAAPDRSSWTTLPGLEVPLVGRAAALQQLEQAYARARAGHGGMVLISGEAGIGKSRLMQEFATRLQGRVRPLVLAGSGYPGGRAVPYLPLVEALRPALGVQQLALGVHPAWLAEASRLMPELRELYSDLPSPLPAEPDLARPRLFEALCQFILGLAASREPVILCLDDLHWADSTTLDWLAHMGRKLHGNRLLVLGAYQLEEASAVSGLRQNLVRWGVLSELELEPLDGAEIMQVLQHLGDLAPGFDVTASHLHRSTGGNPFFLLETVRALIEPGQEYGDASSPEGPVAPQARPSPEQELPLPGTIQATVEARVGRRSARARQVLEAGAVLGRAFAFDLVHRTAGRRQLETMDGLDELVGQQLLEEMGGGYRFRHQVVQTAVYRGLGRRRRSLLHRRAAGALEKLQPDDAAALAWHFEGAGELGRAARYALQAGQAAKAVFGHAEARAYADRALALLEREAESIGDPEAAAANRRLRLQALYERGWALRLLGEMEAYSRDLQEVVGLVELLDDPCTLAHLRWRQAYTHRWFCRYTEAREAAEEGLRLGVVAGGCTLFALCREVGVSRDWAAGRCPFEALCWREIGIAAREMGDYEQAEAALARALDRFVELGVAGYEIHTMSNLSTLYWRQAQYEAARDLSHQALARCQEAGLALERRLPLGDLGAVAAALGDGGLARQYLQESLATGRQIADRTQEIFCLGHLGWLDIGLGQPAQAMVHLSAALALASSVNSCAEQSWLLSGLAEAHRLSGDGERAQARALEALEMAQATNRPHDQLAARRVLERLEAS